MRLGAFQLNEPLPELKQPHALAILQPWIDAGSVGSLIFSWLETHLGAKELTRLTRPGRFFDFTRYRPTSYYQEGRRQLSIPNTYITYAQQKTGNDFLFLHLLEPHSQSEVYIESLLRLLERFNIQRYCLIGSMYDLVPHTRPLLVSGGGVGKQVEEELGRMGLKSSNYQGPTTIVSLLPQRAQDLGIETMSLIVHLPQYTDLDSDYMGAVELMKMLGARYDLPLDKTYLQKAEQQLEQINTALSKNQQLRGIVQQLETNYETRAMRKREEEEMPRLSPEVEKFLMEMDKRFREGNQ